jgi:hypothetical protein
MSDKIHAMIQSCEFTKDEVDLALFGQCMWFAMAMQDVLTSQTIENRLIGASKTSGRWSHILLRHGRSYYDIRGKVCVKAVHVEYATTKLTEMTKEEILNDRPWDKEKFEEYIDRWKRRFDPK